MIPQPYKKPDEPWNPREKEYRFEKPKALDPFITLLPFFQSWTVGFDRHLELLKELQKFGKPDGYPPYNIKEVEPDHKYEIEMAVAGLSKEDITISITNGKLLVEGDAKSSDEDSYVHKGIAARAFSRSFILADYVEIIGASLENGILTVSLERKVPEDKKTKTIKIK